MKISKDIQKELNSFELSELTKILEAVAQQEYYASGMKNISGGYAEIEDIDIDYGAKYIEEIDDEVDVFTFCLKSGEQDMGSGHSNSYSTRLQIGRNVVGDQKMSLKDKLKTIED